MDEIKVVPYIPDEDYDNPAMVVDFYEFTMANCLFLHGFKNTTLHVFGGQFYCFSAKDSSKVCCRWGLYSDGVCGKV